MGTVDPTHHFVSLTPVQLQWDLWLHVVAPAAVVIICVAVGCVWTLLRSPHNPAIGAIREAQEQLVGELGELRGALAAQAEIAETDRATLLETHLVMAANAQILKGLVHAVDRVADEQTKVELREKFDEYRTRVGGPPAG